MLLREHLQWLQDLRETTQTGLTGVMSVEAGAQGNDLSLAGPFQPVG